METLSFGTLLKIQTDLHSLKYLLEQKIGTPLQHKWITKLLGYEFIVKYKQGKENKVVDTLSMKMKTHEKVGLSAITAPANYWLEQFIPNYAINPKF